MGTFRAYEASERRPSGTRRRGYVKPIMIAGGIGSITDDQVDKKPFSAGTPLVVLGGPAMLIGLGGGAASSVGEGTSGSDFGLRLCSACESRDGTTLPGSDRPLLVTRIGQSDCLYS